MSATLFLTKEIRSMDTVFDIDAESLASISLGGSARLRNAVNRDSMVKARIETLERRSLLHSFCILCKHFNIDPLLNFSMHLVTLLCAKVRNKQNLCETLKRLHALQVHLDYDSMSNQSTSQDILTSESDWTKLLCLCTWSPNEQTVEAMQDDYMTTKLKTAMTENGLDSLDDGTIAHALVAMHIQQTKMPKMLERAMRFQAQRNKIQLPADFELRCIKIVANFTDDTPDEAKQETSLLVLLHAMTMSMSLKDEIMYVLHEQAKTQYELVSSSTVKRQSLREVVEKMQKKQPHDISNTFMSWAQSMLFTIHTSHSRQKLLYFICAQTGKLDSTLISKYCSEAEVERVMQSHIVKIDCAVIQETIKSLRTYQHNCKHLIDFRTKVLCGLNMKLRMQLNLAQVLQLYVTCYQHESILQEIWKSIVPVWNHTLHIACTDFRNNHTYEIDSVVQSIYENMCLGHANF